MKKDAKKKKAKDSIGARVKRMKKKDGKSASSGPHSPSLLKSQDVVNLVIQAHGKSNLARTCTDDETPETVPEGWFCIHEKYISKCHLRFPLPTLFLDLLKHYQLALSQLFPSVIRVVNGFITRAKEEGVIVRLSELMSLFLIKESSSKDGGSWTYYLPCRPGLGIFKFTASDDDWRKKYFYVKIDPSTVPVEIEDPVKLSGKLTRALYRKLQHIPNTWGAYTTTRVGSARFPERYKASFPDSVTVAGLEVSEGESIFSVSSGASTSERTQSHKMPIQPSFRSRVLDDSWGLATLMRHMKRTGCALPSITNLANKEEYVEIAHCMGHLAGAINRAQFKFEETVHNAPNAGELAQVTELVRAIKMELDQARVQVSELQAEVKRLGSKADIQQGKIESQMMDIQVKGRKIAELESARKIAEYQVKELIASSQDNQRNKEAEVKLAVRRGKKEVADAYNKVLVSVKEKFSKKKDEVDLLIYAQELQTNTELLKDMLNNEIKSAEEEYNRLVTMMPEAFAAYEKAQYGSNLGLVGSYSAPVEATPGDDDKEMEEEVPDKEDDPVDEGAKKSSGDKEV
ncbi:uncharacterized protein LOC130511243 [Raphanus sativus]|uniref:Uncharacterized protein LOC130511243 n=1 Tax=Raphanus sativus TaxID=3726 RepID=A0A9W3DJR8_RAPSA|nr:uncharacterized protein LOC130511243 [Raphanus sativus]